MKNFLVLMAICIMFVAGCSWLNKYVAPSQVDAQGQIIPGTHTPTPLSQDAAGAIPYGGYALSIFLFAWNMVEKIKSVQVGNGLKATVLAIENAAKDPTMKDAIAKLKLDLAQSHQAANVQPLINDLLAKLKFGKA